jgi:hypothetical protein
MEVLVASRSCLPLLLAFACPACLSTELAARGKQCSLKSSSAIMLSPLRSVAAAEQSSPQNSLETRAIGMLQHAAPRKLRIDEIQRLLSCGLRDQRAALNAIKFLANKQRISIVAAGTREALHVMRAAPRIASRFEQLELPVSTESQELRRFIAGYLALLPIRRSPAVIDKRFVEYLLELSRA